MKAPVSPAPAADAEPLTLSGLLTEGNGSGDAPILGRVDYYVLRRCLGQGDFGAVYLADDTVAQIPVVLKALPGQIANNPSELQHVRENFALVQKLHHPNIVALQHLHKVEMVDTTASQALHVFAGDYLLVMEYAAGSTLSDWRCLFPGRKVPLAQALHICRQIAAALDYAHAEKIVHLDIKPANIVVSGSRDDLRIKVLDFGLAAKIRSSLSRVSKDIGDASGAHPYMSPEQWSDRHQGTASDQYSLAVLFYELISGAVPFASAFETNDPVVMARVAEEKIPETLPELSKQQNAALLQALAKNPSERFSSCRDFITVLEGERRGGSVALRVVWALVLLLALVFGGTYAWRQYQFYRTVAAAEAAEARREAERAAQIAEHLAAALSAATHKDWAAVIVAAEKVLALDAGHGEARKLWDEANHQLRIPTGYRAAPGTRQEPYTNTGRAQSIIHETTGIELVYIPAGSFMMGSPKSEQDDMFAIGYERKWLNNESPQHEVTLSQGFYLGKTEVTQAQWKNLMGNNPSFFQNAGLDAPVERVSWNECQEFCRKAGSGLRLPTEAEWEYACRAGTTTALYSGEIKILGERNAPALDPIAWYGGNSGVTYEGGAESGSWKEKQENHQWAGTHPVGRKKANAWGLHDMIGNVCEWCQDWFGFYPTGAATNPKGPDNGKYHVLRGGSWNNYAKLCRSADRYWNKPDYRRSISGFRVCCSVSDGKSVTD